VKKRIGILTSGGDVQPLNALISSVRKTAKKFNVDMVGFIKGWEGALHSRFVELSSLSIDPLIGGTILKSSRLDLSKINKSSEKILNNLEQNDISGLIVIGGDDALANSLSLRSFPHVYISKTIDNDIGTTGNVKTEFRPESMINFFTLGFPSASSKMASFISLKEGLRTTAYSHERIIIVESMGMHTGWLALSSGMGSPDFIIIPEFPLDYESFLKKTIERYEKQRHLIIVVAEGAKMKDGTYIYAEKDEIENFNHPRFGIRP